MAKTTTIAWCERSWNPIRAKGSTYASYTRSGGRWVCATISPGCDHCYASSLNRRVGGALYRPEGEPLVHEPYLDEEVVLKPVTAKTWAQDAMIFLSSMTDIYGDWVPDAWLDTLFAVMALTPWNVYQVLTKRPSRALAYLTDLNTRANIVSEAIRIRQALPMDRQERTPRGFAWPLPNVWQGVSIETDRYVWRANRLLHMPAASRFVSAEPLLGPLPGLTSYLGPGKVEWVIGGGESNVPGERRLVRPCPVQHGTGGALTPRETCECRFSPRNVGYVPKPDGLEWMRAIRDACLATGTAFFMKQWGGPTPGAGGRHLDGRTWDQIPDGSGGVTTFVKQGIEEVKREGATWSGHRGQGPVKKPRSGHKRRV